MPNDTTTDDERLDLELDEQLDKLELLVAECRDLAKRIYEKLAA